jgi:hypothetical protein
MKAFRGKCEDRIERDLDKLLAETKPLVKAKTPAKKTVRAG